ncbi:uncharacterized protein LOC113359999 [Papaver somniferum]|uniref:uncharacterized protein LOC113359999 n=1 Tax=Papaver somniferum TaxID=3469 RepID=UPI000E6F6CAB|nr:uncharacterized protein LOC113359999 [Papaver somniferum]
MGIHDHSHTLIMHYVTSSTFSILLNEAPYGNFQSGRGLRQGCPMSPALFIICSQGLSLLMEKENVHQLKCILDTYSSFSGQAINFLKSSIHFNRGCIAYYRGKTIQTLGVKEMQKDEKYLGTYPLISDRNIDTFEPLNSNFNTKLVGWGSFFVNQVGRTVLSKSVLSTIPVYSMSSRILP